MHEFVKNILNYFAAFTETRFSSRSTLNYKWLNDENLTLDLTFFSEFRELIISKLESSDQSQITIKPLQYKVEISSDAFKEQIIKQINNFLNLDYLIMKMQENETKLEEERKIILENKEADSTSKSNAKDDNEQKLTNNSQNKQGNASHDFQIEKDLVKIEKQALELSIREYNNELIKIISKILKDLQLETIKKLEADFDIDTLPHLSFNLINFIRNINEIFRQFKEASKNIEEYYYKVFNYFETESFELTLFDLYQLMKGYSVFETYGTAYLFLDSIKSEKVLNSKTSETIKNINTDKPYKEDQNNTLDNYYDNDIEDVSPSNKKKSNRNISDEYPLAFIEIRFSDDIPGHLIINFPRDLVLLNTPAINAFDFNNVLTIPRASSFAEAKNYFETLNDFIDVEYKLTAQNKGKTIKDKFFKIFGPTKDYPTIKYRTGFQVIKNEDKRILDYSELMTKIEKGEGSKILDFVNNYLNNNVIPTIDEVDAAFKNTYATGTPKYFITDNPLPLNSEQKKILLALNNPKNKTLVIEGPPGTGKSHTIAAITYWANQNNKSVVITSHKKEALDVVDRMLTDNFKKLHLYAKPSIIRLLRSVTRNFKVVETLNTVENSLAQPVIDSATDRALNTDIENIKNSKDKLKGDIENNLGGTISRLKNYPEYLNKIIKFLNNIEKLEEKDLISFKDFSSVDFSKISISDFELFEKFTTDFNQNDFKNISLFNLTKIFENKAEIEEILNICEDLNKCDLSDIQLNEIDAIDDAILNEFKETLSKMHDFFKPGSKILGILPSKMEVERNPLSIFITDYSELIGISNSLDKLSKLQPKLFILKNKDYIKEEDNFKNNYKAIYEYWKENKISVLALKKQVNDLIDYIKVKSNNCHSNDFIFSLTKNVSNSNHFEDVLKSIKSLKFETIINFAEKIISKNKADLELSDLDSYIQIVENSKRYATSMQKISNFEQKVGFVNLDYKILFSLLNKFNLIIKNLEVKAIDSLNRINDNFSFLLSKIGFDFSNLSTIFKIKNLTENENILYENIKIFIELTSHKVYLPEINQQLIDLAILNQKITEHQNDLRLKDLNNHMNDIARIRKLISSNKRLTPELIKVLLSDYSCIISEPEAIFRFFPMEEDLIDILIFDEASQVSIAHSISLILRAKQVIVFGDKYQYGAVGAVNVSKKYAGNYFKKIGDSFNKEYHKNISEEALQKIIEEESTEPTEEELSIVQIKLNPELDAIEEWIKTFSIRTSTLDFCYAISNYHSSLKEHFRSFKEIIDYSNEFFYKKAQIALVVNRLRTKPIRDVLRFIKVETSGLSGRNINLDELDAIKNDIENIIKNGFKGTIGVITSFREQKERAEEYFREKIQNFRQLQYKHKFIIWFVGDVQGEERDVVYYSFVQDDKFDNADLSTIYPVPNGTADKITSLKMQRLNVGFSRAKDTMVFVHSMNLDKYLNSRLGDALKFYYNSLIETEKKDYFIEDDSKFESPMEKWIYNLLIQTEYYKINCNKIKIIPQFEIGRYISQEYNKFIPKYRADFLLTLSEGGKEKTLILEYDGIEYHIKNLDIINDLRNFDLEYLDYDIKRQLELESYGYRFLRINKFTLIPKSSAYTEIDMLNELLKKSFSYN